MTVLGRLLLAAAAMVVAVPAAAQQRDFDIAEMPAARSIPEFARQAGLQIVAPADELDTVTTRRISGRLDARTALRRLIDETPLEIVSDDGRTVVLRVAPPRPASEPAAAEIVVTGSRIQSTESIRPAALVSIAAEELSGRYGGVSLGDQLSLLPPLRPTATQSTSTGIGTQASGQIGLNLLDLRGLGPARTLVLINGRRVVTSTQLVSQPDINTIPLALLERVDILTGGASAVYGADAIAGVVNFVLKEDFGGVAADGQAGISARGDAATRQASLLVGGRLGSGRGNLALALAYAERDQLPAAARTFAAVRSDFIANPRAGEAGAPATIAVRDLRSLTVSAGGTLGGGPPFFRFAPDGSLNPADPGAAAFPDLGLSQGGDGAAAGDLPALLPRNQRYAATLLGYYDIADHLTFFGQADAVRQTAQALATPTIAELRFRPDNPFLSAQARATLATLPDAEPTLGRTLDDIAPLSERNTRTTLRGLAGARGDLGDHLRYELSYGFGRTSIAKDNPGNIDLGRLALALDAVADAGAPGGIACRSRRTEPGSTDPAIAGCVPIDIFGAGAPSDAARDYVSLATRSTGRFQQHLAAGFLAGDTGRFLRLPGGPVGVIAGFEFRRETTRYTPDPRDERGSTLVAAQRLVGAVDVLEGYGEFTAPLLAEIPGAHRLEVGGALRVSRYALRRLGVRVTGGANLLYQPVRAVALRASLQRAMRAPNITELYQPSLFGQADLVDPCDARFIDQGTPARRANCSALGIPADFLSPATPIRVATRSAGNPDLDVERGRTLTLGLVFEPERLPELRLALDYYDIDLKDAIAQPGGTSLNPSTIAAGCVDVAAVPNPFCALVGRNPASSIITDIQQFPINLTRLRARGIDLDARWRAPVGRNGQLDLRLLANHVLVRDDFRVPAQPRYATRLAGTPLEPRWQATVTTNLSLGPATLFHRLRYLSSVYYRTDDVAFFRSVNGLPPVDPDRRAAGLVKTGDTVQHDLRAGLTVGRCCQLYLGVDNLFDVTPPFGLAGSGQSGAQFDAVGRYLYTGIRMPF